MSLKNTKSEPAQPLNWPDWIKSEEGKRASNFDTLIDGDYLENRLWAAFVAGAKYERDIAALKGKS